MAAALSHLMIPMNKVIKSVNSEETFAVEHMSTHDPVTVACLNLYCNALNINELEYSTPNKRSFGGGNQKRKRGGGDDEEEDQKSTTRGGKVFKGGGGGSSTSDEFKTSGSGGGNGSHGWSSTEVDEDYHSTKQTVLRRWWRRFARELLMNFQRFGFCVFVLHNVQMDASRDRAWMREFKEIRDEAGMGYDVEMTVPVAVELPTYTAHIETSRDSAVSTLVIRPVNEFSSVQMHVVQSGQSSPPSTVNGTLRSKLATFLSGYRQLAQMEYFNIQASYVNCIPTVVVQHELQKGDVILDNVQMELTGEAEVNDNVERAVYRRESTKFGELQNAVGVVSEKRREKAEATTDFYRNPTLLFSGYQPLVQPTDVNLIPLSGGMKMATQPSPAIPPSNLMEQREFHIKEVCQVMQIPLAMVAGVVGARENTTVASHDMQQFMRTIESVSKDVLSALDEVYSLAHPAKSNVFRFHFTGMTDASTIAQWCQEGVVSREKAQRTIGSFIGVDFDLEGGENDHYKDGFSSKAEREAELAVQAMKKSDSTSKKKKS